MTFDELHDQFILALPLNCKSFQDLSDHFYDDLYQKMHATPFVSTQHYKFLLPDDASDAEPVDLSFFISLTDHYCAELEIPDGYKYRGNSKAFAKLATGKAVYFEDWDDFVDYLRSLHVELEPELPNLNTITEYDQLIVPKARDEPYGYEDLKAKISQRVMGQEFAIDTIAYQTAMALRKQKPMKPISFMCYGQPGTGKSESAKALADILSRHPSTPFNTVWVDLNTFTEAFSVYRLTGSPPGYVGYDDKPVFEAVEDNPYTVFIFDELDKAHPEVIKVFMAILDEGRCASRKELKGHVREYDFKHCIFFFTTNFDLSASAPAARKKIGFAIDCGPDNAVDVSYSKQASAKKLPLPQQIYAETERARQALTNRTGTLQEIASRFTCFVEFSPLGDTAKIRILAKQIVETGMEYGVRLAYIAPGIMQEVINAATAENSLTVRSFKAVIEGYLAFNFAATGAVSNPDMGEEYRLEGSLQKPKLLPVRTS